MKSVTQQDIYGLCYEIEKKAAEIMGSEILFSDYNLCTIQDWLSDEEEGKMEMWLEEEYKFNKDEVQYLMGLPISLIAVEILFRDGPIVKKL